MNNTLVRKKFKNMHNNHTPISAKTSLTQCKKVLPILLLTFLSFAALAQNTDRIDFVVRHITRKHDVKHASLGVCVHNITKDSTIYTRNEDLAMMPAAINKLFTTAASYSRLGPKFTFETNLLYSGSIDKQGNLNGDIIVVGSGDPFFCSDRFPHTDSTFFRFTSALRKLGIKHVNGHIYVDTSLYDDEMVHPSWQWRDLGNYYGSGASGLNYNENSIDVHLRAGRRVGTPAVITGTHPDIPIANHAVTGTRDTNFDICFFGSPYESGRICRGVIPMGASDTHFRASLPQPGLTMAKDFTAYLRNHGISVSGEPSVNFDMPTQYRQICADTSFSLFMITALTMQTNSTIASESLFKLMGYIRDGHGGYGSGRAFMYDYFKELGLDGSEVNIVDGSGLSRDNHVTPYFVCQFLDAIARQPFFLDFVGTMGISANLPEAAIIPNLPEDCFLKIKCGVMQGVRNFVGYFTNENDEMFCFSILCNNYDCSDETMDSMIKGILDEIVRL